MAGIVETMTARGKMTIYRNQAVLIEFPNRVYKLRGIIFSASPKKPQVRYNDHGEIKYRQIDALYLHPLSPKEERRVVMGNLHSFGNKTPQVVKPEPKLVVETTSPPAEKSAPSAASPAEPAAVTDSTNPRRLTVQEILKVDMRPRTINPEILARREFEDQRQNTFLGVKFTLKPETRVPPTVGIIPQESPHHQTQKKR